VQDQYAPREKMSRVSMEMLSLVAFRFHISVSVEIRHVPRCLKPIGPSCAVVVIINNINIIS
jgi:hypothetical protein